MKKAISNAIRGMRAYYIAEGLAPSHYEINNGLCDDFARSVATLLGGESTKLYSVEGGNFVVDGDPFSNEWDWELLASHWHIAPPAGLSAEETLQIDFGPHIWLTDGTLHYDAECPEGVASFFELPLYRRGITLYLRSKGKFAEEVVTDDVVPYPLCPVHNPVVAEPLAA